MNLRDPIFDKILTPQQYGEIAYETPLILKLQRKAQSLFLYGTEHSSDIENPKFLEIEDYFNLFLLKYEKKTICVAVESNIPQDDLSKTEMVGKYKEAGFLAFLARKEGVELICPEPHEKIVPLMLDLWSFNKEDVVLWAFLNFFSNHLSKLENAKEEQVQRYIEGLDRFLGIGLSVEGHWQLFRQRLLYLTGTDRLGLSIQEFIRRYTVADVEELKKIQNPHLKGTVLNDIASAFTNTRDRYIAATLKEVLDTRRSIFSVFGTNHVMAQKPFFEWYFSSQDE